MSETVKPSSSRVDLVDALRGLSILAFILLHNIQHYSYYQSPAFFPHWLKMLDDVFYYTCDFLFGSKSYLVFTLLFGFSFFIQNQNQERKGKDFRLRFIWRMVTLILFSAFNTIFYSGDILSMYILTSFVLLLTYKLSDKNLLIVATILLLQPYLFADFFLAVFNSDYTLVGHESVKYIQGMLDYFAGNSFVDHAVGNLTIGKLHTMIWSWETGRFFQTASMFMFGIWVGRKKTFLQSEANDLFWKKGFKFSAILLAVMILFKNFAYLLSINIIALNKLLTIFTTWYNFAVALLITSLFYFAFYKGNYPKIMNKFMELGKMSLTAYIMQSIFGAFLYYNYGLGLFKYTGGTFCFMIAVVLFIIQLKFCEWWLKTHKQGPVEHLWYKMTWISFTSKKE